MKKRFKSAPFIFTPLESCHPKNTDFIPRFRETPIVPLRRKNYFEKRRAS